MGVTASREAASQPRADARRNIERILEAAEACLARNPNASMSDIAAQAGLGRVTIYGHFASRQVLVGAVGGGRRRAGPAQIDAGRLDPDQASSTITNTMLAILRCQTA